MKLNQWMIEQAAKETRRQLEQLRYEVSQLKNSLASTMEDNRQLRTRIREIAPQKQFQIEELLEHGGGRSIRAIQSVYSSNGKTVIVI